MPVIPPSGEVSQATAQLPAVFKANVIAIIADASGPATGVRLTGTVSGSAGGQTQIHTASGTITVTPVAGLADGATVAMTLRTVTNGLVAQIRPITHPSQPALPVASGVAQAAPSAPPIAPTSAPSIAPLPSMLPAQTMPTANAALSTAAAAHVGSSPATQRQPAATPTDSTGQALVHASGNGPLPAAGGTAAVAVATTSTSPTLPSTSGSPAIHDGAPHDAAPMLPLPAPTARPATATERSPVPAQPRSDPAAPTPSVPSSSVTGGQRNQADGSRPHPPVDPGPLLDLLQSALDEPASARPSSSVPSTPQAVRPPKLDLDKFGTALAGLIDAHPAMARSLLATALPQPNSNLGKVLHAFVAAMDQTDLSLWLGPDLTRQVAASSPSLADHLSQLVEDSSSPSTAIQGGWRDAALPLVTPTGLLPMRLLVEERPDDESTERLASPSDRPTRLILECTLSRFDRIQLDTLVRKPQRCDVIVRSTTPLPGDVQAVVARGFAGIAAQTGLIGAIAFQSAPAGFVEPAPPVGASRGLHLSA